MVDPGIVLLPDNHRIFVLYPGEHKRFYREFYELSAVFLDFPGVRLQAAPSEDDRTLWNQLRMGRAIASWHRQDRPEDKRPSRDASTYKADAVAGRDRPRYFHEFIDLFSEAKKGDLVIVPGPGYGTMVLFGEFTGDFVPEFTIESQRYPFEHIHARQVKWLPIEVRKSDFSPRLIQLMQNRAALIRIKGEADVREVYLAAYGNYIWHQTSGNLFRTKKEQIDLNDLAQAIDLVNFFSAQYLALKHGELQKFLTLSMESLDVARNAYYDKSYFGSVEVEIHSPGKIGRVIKGATVAAYVSTMIALSMTGVSAQDAKTAKVENSASPAPTACDLDLEADIRETMNLYANFDVWEKVVCPRSKMAKDTVGLEPDAKIK